MSIRALLCSALVTTLGVVSAQAAGDAAPSDILKVTLDQAKVAKVPVGTATLVVGNPAIADVTMLKGGLAMIVTGKGYGMTNLVAIDAQGDILDEKQIRVDPARSVLVVQRGNWRKSYTCNPLCMPTVQLGDDKEVFNDAGSQITTRNALAQGAAASGPK